MGFNDRAANGQPHSYSLRSSCEKRFKEAGHVLRLHSNPTVFDGNTNLVGILHLGPDQQSPTPVANPSHGFDSIQHQIQNYLLQLNSISKYRRQVRREFSHDGDFIPRRLTVGQGDDFSDDFIDLY